MKTVSNNYYTWQFLDHITERSGFFAIKFKGLTHA